MTKKRVTNVRIQEIFYSNFVNIVLAVISIIQGLAFNDLANRFSQIYTQSVISNDFKVIAHFILSFVLLLRIFQTYIIAALDYEKWDLGFADMFIIFVVGLMEYFVFSSLTPKDFNVSVFHERFYFLSLLAFLGYLRAIVKIHRNRFSEKSIPMQNYETEMRLQFANIVGTIFLQAISLYVIFSNPLTNLSYTFLGLASAIIIIMNISYSLRTTFTRPKVDSEHSETVEENDNILIEEQPPKNANIEIRAARKRDVDEILNLVMENFAYVYETLFDTSPRLTRRIMRTVLLTCRGNHEWGFQKFYVAIDRESERVVGLLKLETLKTGISPAHFFSAIILAIILVRYLGIIGLIRTIMNSKSIQFATYPIFQFNELHIHYLAVDKSYRRKSVGIALINYACEVAQLKGKDFLALEVRSSNLLARSFFKKKGFKESGKIVSEYDYLFGKGNRIRMNKKV